MSGHRGASSVWMPAFGRSKADSPDAPTCLCSPVMDHKFGREGKDLQKNWGELPGEVCAKDSGGGTIPEDGRSRATLKKVEAPWASENQASAVIGT